MSIRWGRLLSMVLLFGVLSSLVMVDIAEAARRFGGSRSIGLKRGDSIFSRSARPTPQASAAQKASPQRSGMSRWLGPLAGLAAGLGLAALASHLGLGQGFGMVFLLILMVGGGFLLFRALRTTRRGAAAQHAFQYSNAASNFNSNSGQQSAHMGSLPSSGGSGQGQQQASSFPPDFDQADFERQAKVNFLRLQAAHDRGDLADIREFCTPEVYAQVSLDLQERSEPQSIEIVSLEVEFLDWTQEDARTIISVRFCGISRGEDDDNPSRTTSFDEVWHLTKRPDEGWLVAGIEQIGA